MRVKPSAAALLFLLTICTSGLSQDSLKILSWNIKMLPSFAATGGKAKRAKAIVNELTNRNYDVIIFQEAFHKRSRRIIIKGLRSQYPHRTAILNKQFISLKCNGGVIILSRHPIKETHEIRYKERTGFDKMARKGALLAELDVHGKRVQVAGTHLQAFGPQEIMNAQYRQLSEELLQPTCKDGVPQFLCGDFNTLKFMPPQLPADISQRYIDRLARYQEMIQTLNALDGELAGEQQFTMDRPYNDMCETRKDVRLLIDFVLVRPNGTQSLSVQRKVQIIRSQWHQEHKDLSDHYGLEAVIAGY